MKKSPARTKTQGALENTKGPDARSFLSAGKAPASPVTRCALAYSTLTLSNQASRTSANSSALLNVTARASKANGQRGARRMPKSETPEGAVLIHCFAGCMSGEVVASVGLEMQDLFPPSERLSASPKRLPRLLASGQALEPLADETTLVAVAACNVGHGVQLTQSDTQRLMPAAGRINWLRQYTMGAGHASS